MHKPYPKLPADQQDKRAAVSLEPADEDQRLTNTAAHAEALVRVARAELFRHSDANPSR
jgi:hypothetical protein